MERSEAISCWEGAKSRKEANFVFPVIDGKIYVGQRATQPHVGCYGAIGGKTEPQQSGFFMRPTLKETISGALIPDVVSCFAESSGMEYPAQAAVRELCQEIFTDRAFPDEFNPNNFSDPYRIGSVVDYGSETAWRCTFHVLKVKDRDFSLNRREIRGIKPLIELNEHEQLYPLSKYALEGFRRLLLDPIYVHDKGLDGYRGLEQQIPRYTGLEFRIMGGKLALALVELLKLE